jgi:NAD(P)-dependent dehydrogenase (short-subunit alcohol dehydrogenase family)
VVEDLAGRTAVVTGGGSGIGRGMALTWASAGMNVVVVDIDETSARAVAEEVRQSGADAAAVQCDVSKSESVEAMAARAYGRFGEVNVLCNNAAVGLMGEPVAQRALEDWHWTFQVNVFGIVHALQSFLPRMRQQDGPAHIVNTGSGSSISAADFGDIGPYVASKGAVASLTERLRMELAPEGIGVSLLYPSRVTSGFHANSMRNLPESLSGHRAQSEASRETPRLDAQSLISIDPLAVGAMVRDAALANRAYIHTDHAVRAFVQQRFSDVIEAFAFAPDWR